jgi:DNA modification methylase
VSDSYLDFLRSKIATAPRAGMEVDAGELHPRLFPHQRDAVRWALAGGRRAIFASFGLGKTTMQLEIARQVSTRRAGQFLIVLPLGVRMEFAREAAALGIEIRYVTSDEEARAGGSVLMTNYERVRDGHISPGYLDTLTGVSLDEASVLRSFGSKTYQGFLDLFAAVPFRFVATATPSPNRFKELIHYGGFLGVMDTGQALTRFFQRDSEKAGNLTLMPHMAKEFWLWMSSWALFLTRPSDLGYSDEGYSLPPLNVHWHCVDVRHEHAGADSWGQQLMFRDAAAGVRDAAREKRDTLPARLAKAQDLIATEPNEHWLLWHHLEAERHAIEVAWKAEIAAGTAATVYGSQDLDEREAAILDFADGRLARLATKPEIAGSGTNLQRHCARAVFLGIDYSFNDLIQSIHRIYRFQQTRPVDVHIIYADSEVAIVRAMKRKWAQHEEMTAKMIDIVQTYGLSDAARRTDLERSIGVDRREWKGHTFTAAHNDCVPELAGMPERSVDMVCTSIPFGNQYEYTPSYNDFGFSESNEQFFVQFERFFLPELLRVMKPGRIAAVHVKDRIRFGKVTGDGFPTLDRFSDKTADAFERAGFRCVGRITITTDVVRENNQTYRLGYTEMCKDGTKMGVGVPEYVLLFRKLPSDTSNSYADEPVVREKAAYPLRRYQIDAHSYWRSSGDRLLRPDELVNMDMEDVKRWWDRYSAMHAYDYETHIELGRELEAAGRLPATFMLLAPSSWTEEVWTDITRMRTLNSEQSRKQEQNHVCPFPLDIPKRCIERWSMPGDLVLDPFGGLGSTAIEAIKAGRRAMLVELNPDYWWQSVGYCRAAEVEATAPTLFDALAGVA